MIPFNDIFNFEFKRHTNFRGFQLTRFNFILLLIYLFTTSPLIAKTNDYKIAISKEGTSLNTVGTSISDILNKELDYNFTSINNESGSYGSIKLLLDGEVDFAITQNILDIKNSFTGNSDYNIKTILPIYDQIFFIIYNDSIQCNSLKELLYGRKVGLGEKDGGTAWFAFEIFKEFGIDTTQFIPVYTECESRVKLLML